ncbi:putative methyltransferase NSUN7 [Dendronephthya gigantea]|uniref:putative methyltransferase NSUN7 n=1 Tax=Dendronephthya gigantea TaxID=151771 RepID=UPI00106C6F0E|nr:putative methyltransferase NSUN7 [Dendronephthya gigantea]
MLNTESVNSKRRKSKTIADNSKKEVESRRPSSDLSKTNATVNNNNNKSISFDNFQHIIYEKAAIVYAYLKGEADAVLPTFQDERVKRRAYSLAFGAKKYESVLNDILLDSYFFSSYFKLESYYRNHVMVMLLDYQQNNFQFDDASLNGNHIRNTDDDPFPHVTEIQDALVSFYIKLRASLARNRIRETALTVEDLLPKEEKEKNEHVCYQPIYAYVNTLRTTVEEICGLLEQSGFVKDNNAVDYSNFSGHRFSVDVHLHDVIIFPRDVKFDVYNHDLVQCGFLVVQDKSRLIAPEVVRSVLFQLTLAKEKAASLIPGEIRPIFNDGDDVIIVHSDSVNLIARVSCYVHPQRSLFVFGVKSSQFEELRSILDILGVQNVVLLEDNFLDVLPNDDRFRKVRIVLYNAACSRSGVISPIDYVLQEGTACVHDLVNGVESNKLRGLVLKHQEIIKHAMKFFFVHYIVYVTNSAYKLENEDVIKNVIDSNHSDKNTSNPFLVSSFLPDLTEKLRTFNANSAEYPPSEENHVTDNYLKLNGKMGINGGFVCLLQRQKLVDSANDVLERAAKKGLMKGTKRGKKAGTPLFTSDKNKQLLDEVPKRLENISVEVADEKEPKMTDKDSQHERTKKTSIKPFQF